MPKKKRGSSFKSGKRKTNPKKNKPDSSESESEVLSVPQADDEESNRAARAVTPKRKISAIFSETIKKVKAVFTRRPSENQSSGNSSPTAGPSNYRGNLSRNDSDSQVVSDSECFDKEKNISIVNSSSDEFDSDAEIKTVHYDEETSDVLSITSSHGAVSSSGSDVLGDVSEKKKSNYKGKQNKRKISSNINYASSALAAIGVVASSVAASSFSFAHVFSPSLSTSNSGKEKETKNGNAKNANPSCGAGLGRRLTQLLQRSSRQEADSPGNSDQENFTVIEFNYFFHLL